MTDRISRRKFLGAAAILGALRSTGCAAPTPAGLPSRGSFVIRNACVMTMDPAVGDLDNADVFIRDGEIIAMGSKLAASGAEVLDGSDMIVLPGFIETHWHTWTSLLRSLAGEGPERGYFPTSRTIGQFYTANKYVYSNKACRRRSNPFRNYVCSRLVPQRARAAIR